MIISPGRRYIFVHIPKTGGTSMAVALEARAQRDDILLGDTPKAKRRRARLTHLSSAGRLWKHSTLADIDGLVSQTDMTKMFVFTLVRNPWDRVVSYYHWLRDQHFDHPSVHRAKLLSFRDFVLDPATRASLRQSPAQSYMTDARGDVRCNAYIRLEHLAQDILPLEAHLGFRLEIPHINMSERAGEWAEYYNRYSAEAVADSCRDDIERFGYQFS